MTSEEPCFTIDKAKIELALRECQAHGHSWEVRQTFGGPSGILCSRCGVHHAVTPSPSRQAVSRYVLVELVEAIAPLMDQDFCTPFSSAWELDPHRPISQPDGEAIYATLRAAWEQAKAHIP